MPLLYITWVRLVLTNVYNIFVPLDSSCEPNTLMVTDEYNSNCWRSIFLPAGCWSQNQWSAFRPLPLPSWQRFFLWNSASYSFCSNPPGAFANPADMEIGRRWHLVLSLSWLESTSCSSTSLLLPVQPDKRPLVGRHQATWAGFPCTDWYSGHQRTSHQLLWELECGRNTIWPHPQASILCSASLFFIRQVRNQTERQQLFPRDCVPVQRSNPLTTRTRCGGGWRLPLKLSGQTSVGEMFWFCTSMTLYIIICCHKGVPFCQVRWAQKIQIWQELIILDHGSITSQP